MKKLFAIILIVLTITSLTACEYTPNMMNSIQMPKLSIFAEQDKANEQATNEFENNKKKVEEGREIAIEKFIDIHSGITGMDRDTLAEMLEEDLSSGYRDMSYEDMVNRLQEYFPDNDFSFLYDTTNENN